MKIKVLLISILLPLASANASNLGDLMIGPGDVYFSSKNPVTSKPTRIYATVHNIGVQDALASVRFTNKVTGEQIGGDQPISLIAGKTDDVFVDWQPESGNYTIFVQIIPWNTDIDDPSNNTSAQITFVDKDTDKDGVGNSTDIDDDNDGKVDTADLFPLNPTEWEDTDGDGKGNNADTDDDNDGTLDIDDAFPLDATEQKNADKDTLGDNKDDDDDNDGLKDFEEDKNLNGQIDSGETDPLTPDSDNDGSPDGTDAFPINATEQSDFDNDGIGNNSDTDDDNDDIEDVSDTNPLNQGPVINIADETISVAQGNTIIIDTSESTDEDGQIVNTIIVIEKITTSTESKVVPSRTTPLADSLDPEPLVPLSEERAEVSETATNVVSPNGETTVKLSSIGSILKQYFGDTKITPIEDEISLLSINENELYSKVGNNFEGSFDEPGTYRISIIAQDDKNETRIKEVIVKVRDYNHIMKMLISVFAILLAIGLIFKYILLAFLKRKFKKPLKVVKKAKNNHL